MNQILLTPGQLLQTFTRFPATLISCVLFCAVAIFNNHVPGIINSDYLLAISFLASVWFTVCQLFFEGANFNPRIFSRVATLVIFSAVAAYIYLFPAALHWHFMSFAVAMLALVPIAPFAKNSADSDSIFAFTFSLARQMILALIISAIIVAGLLAIVFSINLLFDVKSPRVFTDIWFIVASMLFSTLTLAGMPKADAHHEALFGVHLVNALIGYLVIPLLMFYGAILYWYFIVLCTTQNLPKGVIVQMTAAFGIVGIVTHLALDHTNMHKMATVEVFQKYFFKLLIVPLFLMTLAIGIRINAYGLSQPRFIVVMILFWLALVSAFAFTKHKELMSHFVYASATSTALLTALMMIWL